MAITIKLGKSTRSIRYLNLLGFFFILCTLAMVVTTAVDTYQQSKHAKWPSAIGTIMQQTVRKTPGGSRSQCYIESVVRYTVDGKDLTVSTHSRGAAYWEEHSMRKWNAQHPPGTSLPIRYDPQHHDRIVPDAGAMPESEPEVPDDLKGTFVFFILAMACIVIARVTQRGTVKPVQNKRRGTPC